MIRIKTLTKHEKRDNKLLDSSFLPDLSGWLFCAVESFSIICGKTWGVWRVSSLTTLNLELCKNHYANKTLLNSPNIWLLSRDNLVIMSVKALVNMFTAGYANMDFLDGLKLICFSYYLMVWKMVWKIVWQIQKWNLLVFLA